MMIETDICVLGAGPGGVATALQLARLNIRSILVDKAIFPRDKICGDAVSGKVAYAFNRIDKDIFVDFIKKDDIKVNCWGIKLIYPGNTVIDLRYKPELEYSELTGEKPIGFVSKREDFDHFLIEYIKKEPLIDLREGVSISDFEKTPNGYILSDKKKNIQIQAKIVIAADGAQSQFARKEGGIEKDPKHFAGSVRAYYKNVKGCSEFNHIELHYLDKFSSGYLWVFPLPNNTANVGFGMRTDKIKKNKTNLKTDMLKILAEHPRFKDRFGEAELVSDIRGFGLPLGSKKRKLSGENYMLVGDAAALIDPLTGEGIGNAAVSGRFAALQAAECLKENNFSAEFMNAYDKEVYNKLWKELRISTQLQRTFSYSWVVKLTSRFVANNKQFKEVLSAMFSDVDLRKKLRSPSFYFKLLFNR